MPSAPMQIEHRDIADWDPAIGSLHIERNSTEYTARAHHVVDGNASDFEILTDRGHQGKSHARITPPMTAEEADARKPSDLTHPVVCNR